MARSRRSPRLSQSTALEFSMVDDQTIVSPSVSSCVSVNLETAANPIVDKEISTVEEKNITQTATNHRSSVISGTSNSTQSDANVDGFDFGGSKSAKPASNSESALRDSPTDMDNSPASSQAHHKYNVRPSTEIQSLKSVMSPLESHLDTDSRDNYCTHCKQQYEDMSEHTIQEHNACCVGLFLDGKDIQPSETIMFETRLTTDTCHGRPITTIKTTSRKSETYEASDSDLSDAPDPYQSSIYTDEDDPYGDELEFMPLPFVYRSTAPYPIERDGSESNASEIDEPERSIRFPTLTAIEKFGNSLMDAENLDHDELYERIENAQQALVMWQEEWLMNEITVRKLECTHQPDHEKQQTVVRQVRNPRQGPVKPDNKIVKVGHNEVGQQSWDWKDKYKQQQQDMIEAFSYGFEYNPHPAKIGLQDPVTQKPGNTVDGSRSLRNRMPTKKVADNDSGGESEEGRPRRTIRGASSRLASEAPDDARRNLLSMKSRGRAPAVSRIAQLQRQEGRSVRDIESPERLGSGQTSNISQALKLGDDEENGNLPLVSNHGIDVSQDQSDMDVKHMSRSGTVQRRKKKKQPTEKRKAVRQIQLKRPSARTDEETRILKAFREKKGAWATRASKDVEVVLARFDENALLTSSDDEDDEVYEDEEKELDPMVEKKESFSSNPSKISPLITSVRGKGKEQDGLRSRASQNMIERWRKKKEAESRGDTNGPQIGRRTRVIETERTAMSPQTRLGKKPKDNGPISQIPSAADKPLRKYSTSSNKAESRPPPFETSLDSGSSRAYRSTVEGHHVVTFNIPGLQEAMSDDDNDRNGRRDSQQYRSTDSGSGLVTTSLEDNGVKSEVEDIQLYGDPEQPKHRKNSITSRSARKRHSIVESNDATTVDKKKSLNKSGKPRKMRKTSNANALSAVIVGESDSENTGDGNEEASSDVEHHEEEQGLSITKTRLLPTNSVVKSAVSHGNHEVPTKAARGGARKGAGRKKRAAMEIPHDVPSAGRRPSTKRTRSNDLKFRLEQRTTSEEAVKDDIIDTDIAAKFHKKRKPIANHTTRDDLIDSEPEVSTAHKRRRLGAVTEPPLPRKVSVYEEYLALSSPTHDPLQKRGKRSAALKARRSLLAGDDEPTTADEEIGSETSTSLAPERAAIRAIKATVKPGPVIKKEPKIESRTPGISSRGPYMSEYEHFQAIANQSGDSLLGKRRRKPVSDMNRIMALEKAESEDDGTS